MKKAVVLPAVFTVLFFLLITGCEEEKRFFSPAGGDGGDTFKSLTNKEDVVFNLLLSYKKKDIIHFEELLHDDYIWYFQEGDVPGDGPSWTKDDDVQATGNMFLAALGQFEPKIETLTLEIENNEWYPIDLINGEYCEDCWWTERIYHFVVVIGETTYYGDENVGFLVVPVQAGSVKKYKILRAYDIIGSYMSSMHDAVSGTEESSWSSIKTIFT